LNECHVDVFVVLVIRLFFLPGNEFSELLLVLLDNDPAALIEFGSISCSERRIAFAPSGRILLLDSSPFIAPVPLGDNDKDAYSRSVLLMNLATFCFVVRGAIVTRCN
jgi:hypothetical protein